ncbi:MAG: hydrogenase maturation peptidase HycI [Candidatus Verstraetearchaeota archaeon]|nr:hydrogenase maturation peptidase HycI [Candidatus Verstraetearchaeota archaeon]
MMERISNFINEAERIIIMGIGNVLRSDDAAGAKVAELLEKKVNCKDVTVINCMETPENFLGKIEEISPTHIVIIDAVEMNAEPGGVGVFGEEEIDDYPPISTHRIPLSIMAAYIKKTVGAKLMIIGIQPKRIEFGEEISPEVKETIELLAEMLAVMLKGSKCCRKP